MVEGRVTCYECDCEVPLDDVILISGDIDEEFREELDELIKQGLVIDDAEEGDFYICIGCRDKMLGALEEILGGKG